MLFCIREDNWICWLGLPKCRKWGATMRRQISMHLNASLDAQVGVPLACLLWLGIASLYHCARCYTSRDALSGVNEPTLSWSLQIDPTNRFEWTGHEQQRNRVRVHFLVRGPRFPAFTMRQICIVYFQISSKESKVFLKIWAIVSSVRESSGFATPGGKILSIPATVVDDVATKQAQWIELSELDVRNRQVVAAKSTTILASLVAKWADTGLQVVCRATEQKTLTSM